MILIADSGSTKCDWVLVDGNPPYITFSTMGFNPYFHNEAIISNTLRKNETLMPYLNDVKYAYFYGAGCSSEELRQVVKRSLFAIFPKAKVEVGHDLDAAAFATYNGSPGIACILGTGSNSCFFDGEDVHEEVPALAYILGDESSGAYYGKKLLRMFLYKQLPAHLHQQLTDHYQLSKDKIMESVYMKPHANVYLASFMRFIHKNIEEELFQDMIMEGMTEFLTYHVAVFENHRNLPVHFVGSIAFFFRDILEKAAKPFGITLGTVTNRPIDGLVDYHLKMHSSELV